MKDYFLALPLECRGVFMKKISEAKSKTDIIRAEIVSELTEKLEHIDGAVRLGFETKWDICEGVSIVYAGYRKEMYEFCDAFGFMPDYDVTVYKHDVYLYDENENKKSLGIFPREDYKGNRSEVVVNTVAGLLEKLKTICGDKDDIQILSPDSNFELKGSITQGVCFTYEDQESTRKWLILESYLPY